MYLGAGGGGGWRADGNNLHKRRHCLVFIALDSDIWMFWLIIGKHLEPWKAHPVSLHRLLFCFVIVLFLFFFSLKSMNYGIRANFLRIHFFKISCKSWFLRNEVALPEMIGINQKAKNLDLRISLPMLYSGVLKGDYHLWLCVLWAMYTTQNVVFLPQFLFCVAGQNISCSVWMIFMQCSHCLI